MNEEEKITIFNKGFKSGQEHSEPSSQTKQFITKFSMELEYLKDEIRELKEKVPTKDAMKLAFSEALGEFTKNCDNKYASKTSEKVIYSLIGLIVIAVIVAWLRKIGL